MTNVRLDAFGIARDGNDMASASHDLATAWRSLHSVLSSSGGMAGPDEASKEWIDSYDSIAAQAGEASEGVAQTLAAFDSIMGATGAAYKRAELAGAFQDSDGGISIPTHDVSLPTSVPTAMGEGWPGALGEFQGWVEEALASMGLHLPLADTDKMGKAVGAWEAYRDQLATVRGNITGALAVAAASEIPQWNAMDGARNSIATVVQSMGDASDQAIQALHGLIQQTVDARNEIMDIIKELAIAVGVEVGVSIALSFFTFGASAVVGAAATSATVMRFVVRIAEVINRLISLSRIPREAIENGVRLFQAVGRGSKFAKIAGETFKGMATGVISQGFTNTLVEGKSFTDGWTGALLGGAVGGSIGGGLGLIGRTGAGAATRTTATHVVLSTGRGAATGAASGVAGDYVTAKTNGQDFNVIQSLVFGTVGGGAADGIHGGIEARGAHASGGSDAGGSGAGGSDAHGGTGMHGATGTHGADVDLDTTHVTTTEVDVDLGTSVGAGSGAGAHTTAAGSGTTVHTDGPVVSGAGHTSSASSTHSGERPHIDGSQTPVVTGAAHGGGTTAHAGGENVVTHVDHVDASSHDVGAGHAEGAGHADTPTHTESTTHADAPAHAETPAHADAPAHADTPTHTESTTHADAPAHAGTPAHADAPADTDTPAHAEAPAHADTPAHAEAPAHADASAHTDAPAHAEAPEHADAAVGSSHDAATRGTAADSVPSQHGSDHVDTTSTTSEHIAGGDVRDAVSHAESPSHADIVSTESKITSAGTHEQPASLHGHDSTDAPAPADHTDQVDAGHAAAAGSSATAATAVAAHPTATRTVGPTSRFDTGGEALSDNGGGSDASSGTRPPLRPEFPESAVARDSASYRQELDAKLHDHGLSRREFRRLVSKPIHRLTPDQMDTLLDIRKGLDPIETGDVVQKVIPETHVTGIREAIDSDTPGYFGDHGFGGFIAKFSHLTGISNHAPITPLRVFQKLGLGYNTTSFPNPSNSPIHGIRMRIETEFDSSGRSDSDVFDRMKPLQTIRKWLDDGTIDQREWAAMSNGERHSRLNQLADALPDGSDAQADFRTKMLAALKTNTSKSFDKESFDPFRGNGWAGHYEHYTPEVELRNNLRLTDGAELWRYNPDGTQELVAKWDGARWRT
ncbi:hypothetical protein ACIPJ2_01835 [Curtobacterium sp. NPDC090217]|uniref:hypothetical protein n=1 Tax=Curtobacterium sp. NPDC090217 TaxID=3363970 RepID=UPI003803CF1B